MKRSIIPRTWVDRIMVICGLLEVLPTVFGVMRGSYWATAFFGTFSVLAFIKAYVFPDEPTGGGVVDEYSEVIEKISGIGKQLTDLKEFLERERKRVADTEATVRSLTEEKTKLEPLVLTQRETVEAILAAHAARTARQAWRERMFGFILGLAASLAASFVYEYFKR
jgi:hypothetical protein